MFAKSLIKILIEQQIKIFFLIAFQINIITRKLTNNYKLASNRKQTKMMFTWKIIRLFFIILY